MSQAKQKSKPTSGPKTLPKYNLTQLLNRVNDRFPNFLLGLTVFVLAILVGSLFFQNQELSTLKIPQSITKLFGGKTNEVEQTTPKSYTVKKGDTLWSIAEEAYGSGYNAFDLAKLNNIQNADELNEGVVISLPALESKNPTRGEIAGGGYTTVQETTQVDKTKSSSYKIVTGDSLWSISMKVYGNPYRWTELWRANPTIENPDLIYAGNTLNIK
ncbi:MAG: LysM peptidoglycan-binding domain-containing protein [Microgenomates group bacterium]